MASPFDFSAIHEAFMTFESDESYLALPLMLEKESLSPRDTVHFKDAERSFQKSLSQLDAVLDTRRPAYVLLRRGDSLIAITYVPYLAKESDKATLLEHRFDLVKQLGEAKFSMSLICKEIGEITDPRSWEERDKHIAGVENLEESGVEDLGHKKNACRLCDRRMKNQITPDAQEALKTLGTSEAAVQITVDNNSLALTLVFSQFLSPTTLIAHLPTTYPTFTLYRHPATRLLYFIFHSPDSAPVQARMKHTMAIPGLINVHAEDMGVHVDQKVEIHEPDELMEHFDVELVGANKGEQTKPDDRIGKYRSVYLRNRFEGTESQYSNLEADKKFYDDLRAE